MADVFSPQPVKTKTAGDVAVKLVDTAGSNLAAISAAGALKTDGSAVTQPVSITGNQATNVAQINAVTPLMGNGVTGTGSQRVTIASDNTAFAVNGGKTNNNAAPGATNLGVLGGLANASAPSWTEGNLVALSTDLAGNLRTTASIAANSSVNVAQINGVTTLAGNGVSGTGAQRVTIASDSTGQIALAAGAATIGALSANQSVNNAQVAGNTISVGSGVLGTGTQRVVLATDQPTIAVSTGLSFTTTDTYATSTALAAGATVTIDSTNIGSGTGKLFEATVSASVALKAQLGTWDGTTFTVYRTFFVLANSALVYIPARYDAITKATGATAKFRWSITNNDNANAADVYASTTYAI